MDDGRRPERPRREPTARIFCRVTLRRQGLRLRVACALVLAAIAAAGAPPARGADWADAKRAFAEAQKSKEWKPRRDAYLALADHDNAEAAEAALSAAAKETHGGVLWSAVGYLSALRTPASRDVVAAAVKTGKGVRRWVAILGLLGQSGDVGKDALLEALKSNDGPAAMLAAEALGKKNVADARAPLLDALHHKEWQVRAAAARALGALTGQTPKEEIAALVAALASAEGVERADLVAALEAQTHAGQGYDVEGWKKVAAGERPEKPPPKAMPYAFGVPIPARRVVVVVDHSTKTDDPHPFEDKDRLKEICHVPGGRDVPWYSAKTVMQLYVGHAKRLVEDLPSGSQFDVVSVGGKVSRSEMGKLVPVNAGSKQAAVKALEGLKPEAGLDLLTALDLALDAGGKEPAAFSMGPEEIVLFNT